MDELTAALMDPSSLFVHKQPVAPKYCLECGLETMHTGGFCSAEHSREWKKKQKERLKQ